MRERQMKLDEESTEALATFVPSFLSFASRKCWPPVVANIFAGVLRAEPERSGGERLTRDDCQEKRCTRDGNRHAEEPHIIYPSSPPLVRFYPLPFRDLRLLVGTKGEPTIADTS